MDNLEFFKGVNIIGSRWGEDYNGIKVLEVYEPHALIMAAGYLKYTLKKHRVYFRGQNKLYPELRPSLYRNISTEQAQSNREGMLNKKISSFKKKCRALSNLDNRIVEAMLQHYGLSTTWIDIVDNIWVALWFGCFEAKITKDKEFLHFQKRVCLNKDKDYVYILLIDSDANRPGEAHGLFKGNNTELIDLRMSLPSFFLRPHAQHGLLFRCKGKESRRDLNYIEHVKGIVKIDLALALDWLGDSKTINIHSLFPPAFYDNGYKILLQSGVSYSEKEVNSIGKIHYVGA